VAGVRNGKEGGVRPQRRILQWRHHRGVVQELCK
jgi:hypothetical protein